MPQATDPDSGRVIQDTVRWLERAVIGLNLCPFAKSVHVKGQIHFSVSSARTESELLRDLDAELTALLARPASERDTTLLMVPGLLHDFLDFNDFMERAERLARKRKLEGIVQVASFHPRFQFAGVDEDDITNHTNRAPYPTLHLLREDSIDRAVEAFEDPATIYEANMARLRALGHAGWRALDVDAST